MARDTLNSLRYQLRAMTDAGVNDWRLGTATFWDDDQLDTVLDQHRFDVYQAPLIPRPKTLSGGTLSYLDYYAEHGNLEATDGGTAIFVVEDTLGADVTSGYTADYQRGVVSFASDQAGTVYRLTARSYDLNAAAADVWRRKAARAAQAYDVSTDNHSLSRSQIMKHALQMADYYAGLAEPSVSVLYRSDC
jgi:hypothetical protein